MVELPEGYTLLWSVETGSGMWGTKRNDLDITSVYCIDTFKILRGENVRVTMPHKKYRDEKKFGDIDIEEQAQEIGHLVNKLIDGNFNAITAVCSPNIIECKYPDILRDLKYIIENNLSTASFNSINGMCISCANDHVKRAAVLPPGKAFRSALRVANFGKTMFSQNKIEFVGIDKEYIPTEQEVNDAIKNMTDAYYASTLPDKPCEDQFRDFLYHVRLGFMMPRVNLDV